MRIGELSQRSGLSIDTLRFYEKRGLFGEEYVKRSESGYRDYYEAVIERLELIKGAQAAGFTLSEIAMLFDRWAEAQLTDEEITRHLHNKCNQITAKIAELQQVQRYLEQKICIVTGVKKEHKMD